MCGRFSMGGSFQSLIEAFLLPPPDDVDPRFNIAPTQVVLAIRRYENGSPGWDKLRWGLVPSWAKDPTIGSRMINARSETVLAKPSFRAAFRSRRCLVPADGFFEWKRDGRTKQPWCFRLTGGKTFCLAALWENWTGPDGAELRTFTVLTTEPNALVRPIHDRMPVILGEETWPRWLDHDIPPPEILSVLKPFPEEDMEGYPVSSKVNKAGTEGPDLVKPLPPSNAGLLPGFKT